MKRLFGFLTLLVLPLGLCASEVNCKKKVVDYTSGKAGVPPKSCFSEVLASAQQNPMLYDEDVEGIVQVHAYGNSILIDRGKPKKGFIAGDKSRLHEILSVSVSDDGRKIAVLNMDDEGQKEILIFDGTSVGNISPSRLMGNEFINEMSQITLSGDGQVVYALNEGKNEVIAISSNADSRSRSLKKAVDPSLVHKASSKMIQIQASGGELYVLTGDFKFASLNAAGEKNWSLNLPDKGIQNADGFSLSQSVFKFKSSDGEKNLKHPKF